MFDSVARNPREGGARKGAALVLTLLVSAAVIGALASMRPPAEAPPVVVDLLFFPGEPMLPPAPTPAGGGAQARRSPQKTVAPRVEAPVVPVVEATPNLVDTPEVPELATAAVDLGGDPTDGDPEGRGTGPGKGPGTGKGEGPGGPGDGSGGGGLRTINAHEAVPRVRAEPAWPRAALAVGLTEGRCVVHVVIDESGEPGDVSFKDCPVVFQRATRDAALQWRWYPVLDDGRPVAAQFDIAFLFRR